MKLSNESVEKELIVKLLFIFSTYSRVEEYIKDVSTYMDRVMDNIKALTLKKK